MIGGLFGEKTCLGKDVQLLGESGLNELKMMLYRMYYNNVR